ncbi:hypothetical protein [Enterobacter hormaechei]
MHFVPKRTADFTANAAGRLSMPNPFDVVMFVLLAIGALQQMGWLPW